jgi:N-methylhydantoinase B
MPTDPILLEIMRNALFSIADEMTAAMVRTAYSTNIKDRRDCSSALVTPDGEIVAQTALGTPLHLGLMPGVVRMVLDRYGGLGLEPGSMGWNPKR